MKLALIVFLSLYGEVGQLLKKSLKMKKNERLVEKAE